MERAKISRGIIKKFKLESFVTTVVAVRGEDLQNNNYEIFYKDTIYPIINMKEVSDIILVSSDSDFLNYVKS